MIAAMQTTTAREPGVDATSDARQAYRPVPPPPTKRRDLRRAAAVQAAWLADLR